MGPFGFKYLSLLLIIVLASSIFIFIGPHYEASVDLSLEPPEIARKTDFSWITVNEWFNSQSHIISSYSILQNIESDLTRDEVMRSLQARRLGAADVVRIYARGNDKPETLLKLVSDISVAYLKSLAQAECRMQEDRSEKVPDDKRMPESNQIENKRTISAIYAQYASTEREIQKISDRILQQKNRLVKLKPSSSDPANIRIKIDQLSDAISDTTKRRDELKATYTDNWPEVATLNIRLAELIKENNNLAASLYSSSEDLGKVRSVELSITEDESNLSDLKKKLHSIDLQIATNTVMTSAVPEKDKGRENLCGYGYIINPPSVKVFPFMQIHLACGIVIGILIWLLLKKSMVL